MSCINPGSETAEVYCVYERSETLEVYCVVPGSESIQGGGVLYRSRV